MKLEVTTIKNRTPLSFCLGALVGAVVFFMLYGINVLRFTNTMWLHHSYDLEGISDLSQHYFGWVLYRKSPWHFPLGLLDGLSPAPISVVYTDSIPLFAVIFKLLSPILPAEFQYFGLFEFLTYLLMGGFGALIGTRFPATPTKLKTSTLVAILSALLFVTTPVLTKRVFYHTALSAHFLILAAICLWLYREFLSRKKQILLWTILTLLAVSINAYYVPMVYGILLLSILQEWIAGGSVRAVPLSSLFPMIVFPVIGAAIVAWALGMFYGDVNSSAENIENVSFNLLQFFNPRNDILRHGANDPDLYYFDGATSYSLFAGGFNNFTPWQHEGFSYLGIGLLALILFASVLVLRRLVRKNVDRRLLSWLLTFLIGTLIFTLLAVSPRATVGGHILYYIHWNDTIYGLLSIFRTAGRLIWVVYYGWIAAAVIVVARWTDAGCDSILRDTEPVANPQKDRFSVRRFAPVFALCLLTLVQLIDLTPSFSYKHSIYTDNKLTAPTAKYENILSQNETLQALGETASEIIFVSPTAAIRLRPYWSTVFEEFAIANNLTMNAAYCSRDTSAAGDMYAVSNFEKRKKGETFPDVIYVFVNDEILEQYENDGTLPKTIIPYEGIYIGTDAD